MRATDGPNPDSGGARWRAWRGAIVLTLVVLAARVVYLAWLCPYDLAEDEAFYWEWSRHLDWSYYTKGPGIAWAMSAATTVLGNTEPAVRLVAVLAGAAGALAIAGLTLDLSRGRARAGLLAAALYHLAPGLQATALISTIDGPYIACWAVAAWAGYRAIWRRGRKAWVVLGAAVGAGLLFKYTIVLLAVGLAAGAACARGSGLHPRWRWGVLVAAALAGLGLAPILIWNMQHDWGTVRHLLGHVGVAGGDRPASAGWHYEPRWTLEMLGAQAGFVGPMLWAMIAGLRRPTAASLAPGARSIVIWTAGPILLFYLALTFISSGEGNWPLAGFVTPMALAACWMDAGLNRMPRGGAARLAWRVCLGFGLVAGLGMMRLDLVRAGLDAINPSFGKVIPMHRLTGARTMAEGVASLARQVRDQTGQEPMIITSHYGVAAQLGFYLPGRPIVRTAMSRMGGRTVQQDFWPDASLDDASLLGRPAVLIGGGREGASWARAFERVQPLRDAAGEPRISEDPKPQRWSFIGYGYRGFPARTGGSATP